VAGDGWLSNINGEERTMAPSREHDDAVGEGPERPDYAALEREAAQLRGTVAAKSAKEAAAERLAQIEVQLAARRETEGKAAARQRQKEIRSAVGGSLNEYGKARDEVYAAYDVVRKAIEKLNAMAVRIRDWHAEDSALADRFEVPASRLPNPRSPDAEMDGPALPLFWRFRPVLAATEFDEHGMRERRTYTEVGGSEAFRIITDAGGPKPFQPLTPEQQAEVTDRVEEQRREREAMAEFAREAAALVQGVPEIRTFGGKLGAPQPPTLAERIGE
jgi:hypothetical protein